MKYNQRLVNRIIRIFKNQARSLLDMLNFGKFKFPGHISNTLESDDMDLVRKMLKEEYPDTDQGKIRKDYESQFASWNGSKFAFAFMGGREALSAAVKSLDLKQGDEVLVPAYTCIVVPNAFKYEGITVKYVDIELETFGADIRSVKESTTDQTKAVVIQHTYGLVSRDFEKIIEWAKSNELKIIEDCAHAMGAIFKEIKVGNFGDVAFYSTEHSKIMTTFQGGMVVTNDSEIAGKLNSVYKNTPELEPEATQKILYNLILDYKYFKSRQNWIKGDWYYLLHGDKQIISTTEEERGGTKPARYGRLMPDKLALIGLNQLQKVDHFNNLRQKGAAIWDKWCQKNGIPKPTVINYSKPTWLRYPILVDEKHKQNRNWGKKDLGVQLGDWFVSHTHPVDKEIGHFPSAAIAVKSCVNLPTLLPESFNLN